MILDIDVGNTAVKWRLSEQGVASRPAQRIALGQLDQLSQGLSGESVTDVRISCVAADSVKQKLTGWVQDNWGIRARFAQTEKYFDGLTVCYQNPARLGVDRWLAMLAARRRQAGGQCIIDCGSAITVDLVSAAGQHLGGYIVPGLQMMRGVLLGATGQIRMDTQQPDYQMAWGQDTDEAVNFGIFRTSVSFIESILLELQQSGQADSIYMTGGDAQCIRQVLALRQKQALILVPDLVLDGLAVALP